MAENQVRKADLDKEGITFEDKAEVDSEGIPLEQAEKSVKEEPPKKDEKPQETVQPIHKPTKTILILSIIATITTIILGSTIGILWYHASHKKVESIPSKIAKETKAAEKVPLAAGEILLDPFMVLFNPRNPKETGILVTQLSLQVNPGVAPNVESNLYNIRNIIYNTLSTTAHVYSKNEVSDMIKQDLKQMNIKDITFIQYELK